MLAQAAAGSSSGSSRGAWGGSRAEAGDARGGWATAGHGAAAHARDASDGQLAAASPRLLPLAPALKPFPWPAVTLDLGATAAALFFNMLLVFAFLQPTRAGGWCTGAS